MKTVRFSQVVERSGRPHVHALWVAPERDPEFQRARKADRVMMVEPRGHGKVDVGRVGFDPARQRGSQFLIFPKSLKPFDGRQVVGVKFDLVEQPETQNVTAPQDWKPRAKKHPRSHTTPGSHAPASARATPANANAPTAKPEQRDREASTRKAPPRESRRKHAAAGAGSALLHEVRAALKELRAGKAVAAYERLERAAAEAERAE